MTKETKILLGVLAVAGVAAFIHYRRKKGTCCFSNTADFKSIDWDQKKAVVMVKNKPYTFDFSNPDSDLKIQGGWTVTSATNTETGSPALMLKKDGELVRLIEKAKS